MALVLSLLLCELGSDPGRWGERATGPASATGEMLLPQGMVRMPGGVLGQYWLCWFVYRAGEVAQVGSMPAPMT